MMLPLWAPPPPPHTHTHTHFTAISAIVTKVVTLLWYNCVLYIIITRSHDIQNTFVMSVCGRFTFQVVSVKFVYHTWAGILISKLLKKTLLRMGCCCPTGGKPPCGHPGSNIVPIMGFAVFTVAVIIGMVYYHSGPDSRFPRRWCSCNMTTMLYILWGHL